MNTSFLMSKAFLGTIVAIFAAGAALNLANQGSFGLSLQKGSKFITTGYGAGAL